MNRKIRRILAMCALLFVGSAVRADEASLAARLDSITGNITTLHLRLELARYRRATGQADSLALVAGLYRYELATAAKALQDIPVPNRIKSHGLRRKMDLVAPVLQGQRVEAALSVQQRRDSARALIHQRARILSEDPSVSFSQRLERESDVQQAEVLVREWADVGNDLSDNISELLRERNRLSRKVSGHSYTELLLLRDNFDTAACRNLCRQSDSLSREPYRAVIDYLSLGKDHPLEYWEPLAALNRKLRSFDRFFPADSQLLWIKATMAAMGYRFDDLPIYVEQSMTLPSGTARTFVLGAPYDVRIVYHPADGEIAFASLAGAVSQALAAVGFEPQDELYGILHEPSWETGAADFLPMICRTSEWLHRFPGMPQSVAKSFRKSLTQRDVVLLRLAIRDVQFSLDAYADPDEASDAYWRATKDILFATVHNDLKPWAVDESWLNDPLGAERFITGRLMAKQNVAYLKKRFGSAFANSEIGPFLNYSYFRFGSRYSWRDQVEMATGHAPDFSYLIP